MSPVSRADAAGRAYLDLRALAKAESRLTDELIQLYALEGFLARLTISEYVEQLVLKGGVLLAAFDARRPTRDIDFAAQGLGSDGDTVLAVVRAVASLHPGGHDGLVFDSPGASAEVIREVDQYPGVRVSMNVTLASARVRFHVDVNMGDPIWPSPNQVEIPRLLGRQRLQLVGYPLHMVHAEKIVTAVQRGTVNTRWRDFADVWTLSRRHPVDGDLLRNAITKVAAYRKASISPLREVLDGYPAIAQARWRAWRRRQKLTHLPGNFADLLEDVYRFADPVIDDHVSGTTWHPPQQAWN